MLSQRRLLKFESILKMIKIREKILEPLPENPKFVFEEKYAVMGKTRKRQAHDRFRSPEQNGCIIRAGGGEARDRPSALVVASCSAIAPAQDAIVLLFRPLETSP